jgi:hypothetical protein
METVISEQSTENMAYVRRLLRQKEPGFAAALELAVLLAERRPAIPGPARDISAAELS